MLAELKCVHGELRGAIAALADLLSRAQPDDEALPAVRLRIARASRRQRSLIEYTIIPQLHDVSAINARAVSDLSVETAAQGVKYSEHIGRWTRIAVCADWAGYQRASTDLAREMLRLAEREAAILYPLIETRSYQTAQA